MFLLIDADSLLWKSALGIDTDSWAGTNDVTPDPEDGFRSFEAKVKHLQDSTGLAEYHLAFSEGKSFRKALWPAYKAHRPTPPEIVGQVRTLIQSRLPYFSWPGLEGDDIVGIHSDIEGTVLYSEDKDLLQIPCLHWDWNIRDIRRISPLEGMRFFYSQVLTGDPSDGYKGCPGIGALKAEVLLKDVAVEDMWDLVCLTYQIRGCHEEDALLQARLAWILRNSNRGVLPFVPPVRRTTLCPKILLG